jgi:hypothetical protein
MAVITVMLAGCAPAQGNSLGLDAVSDERAARAESRVDALLASYADYLTDRWPRIRLPQTSIEAWVEPGYWAPRFEHCASTSSGLTIHVDRDVGITSDPPASTAQQVRALETAIYLCQGRLPPPGLAAGDPGPIEIAWLSAYVRDSLPACLRREGTVAGPLPDDPFAILSGGVTPGWNPYASARGNAAELQRLRALCPHPSVLLSTLSPVGAPLERDRVAGGPG